MSLSMAVNGVGYRPGKELRTNDTERLEKLFDLYTKVTGSEELSPKKQRQATRSRGG